MASYVADLRARLDADTGPFERGLRSADSRLHRFGGGVARAFGGFLRRGVHAAVTVGAAFAGMVIFKGAQRAVAIDDANRKLEGLGYTAQETAKITDDALKSVLGTPYSLAEALNVASTAMAAGVKPGQQLSHYLSIVADTASIAGIRMDEAGSILNKATANVRVHTDVLNQLADRGLPVFTWLQKEYGVTADKLREMVQQGEVDSKTLMRVIEENIGGAAKEAGEGIRGSFENLMTALARLGDALLGPVFGSLPNFFKALRDRVDDLTLAIKPFGERLAEVVDVVVEHWPRVRSTIQTVASVIREEVMPIVAQLVDIFRDSFSAIRRVVEDHRDTLGNIWINLKDLIRALMPVIRLVFVRVLPAALEIAVNAVDTFIGIVVSIKDAFITAAGGVLQGVKKILEGFSFLAHAAGKLPGPLGKPFRTAAEAIDRAIGKVDNLQGRLNNLHSKTIHINAVVHGLGYVAALQEHLAIIRNQNTNINVRDHNAGGTRNWKGGLTWVGERGAELVSLPRGSAIFPHQQSMAMAGGGGGTYNFYGAVLDGEKLLRFIRDANNRYGRNNGGRGAF